MTIAHFEREPQVKTKGEAYTPATAPQPLIDALVEAAGMRQATNQPTVNEEVCDGPYWPHPVANNEQDQPPQPENS